MNHRLTRAVAALVAAGTGAVLLSSTALTTAASAAPAGTTNYKINVVGSDTIFCVDGGTSGAGLTTTAGIMSRYTASQTAKSGNQVFVGCILYTSDAADE